VSVAVPETRFRSRPDRYRKALTDQSGRFTLPRVVFRRLHACSPWDRRRREAYYNPNSSRAYDRPEVKALHVTEGLRVSVQLR